MPPNAAGMMNGILIVYKPSGWTSHDVCHFIRKRFSITKVGHAGILDRTATGVLVVLLGFYTKFSSRFLNEIKEYEGTMELGIKTSTHDADGGIVERMSWDHITETKVRAVIESFHGEREQLPPMASAVKLGGVRLYKLARQGKEVERPKKLIHVYKFEVKAIKLPMIHFACRVSKGTYVRTLANDIGMELGTAAYLKELRRTASGVFRVEESVTMDFLKTLKVRESLKPYLRTLPAQEPAPPCEILTKE